MKYFSKIKKKIMKILLSGIATLMILGIMVFNLCFSPILSGSNSFSLSRIEALSTPENPGGGTPSGCYSEDSNCDYGYWDTTGHHITSNVFTFICQGSGSEACITGTVTTTYKYNGEIESISGAHTASQCN
jgi:hypothetical protein